MTELFILDPGIFNPGFNTTTKLCASLKEAEEPEEPEYQHDVTKIGSQFGNWKRVNDINNPSCGKNQKLIREYLVSHYNTK